jgi:hypothetical protein
MLLWGKAFVMISVQWLIAHHLVYITTRSSSITSLDLKNCAGAHVGGHGVPHR